LAENDWMQSSNEMTETNEGSPHRSLCRSWPLQDFNKHRTFDREAENQPYIDWLQDSFDKGVENSEDDEDDEDEDDDASTEGNDLRDEVDGQGDEIEMKDENVSEDRKTDAYGQLGIVRRFMEGMPGDEDRLSRDQVDVVSGFHERGTTREESEKFVALLDERKHDGNVLVKRKHRRRYLGPLTSQQLRRELSKKVSEIFCLL
jgi:hypothetical protein